MTETEQEKIVGLFAGLPKVFTLWFVDEQAYFQVSQHNKDYYSDDSPNAPPGHAFKLTDGRWIPLSLFPISAFKMAQFVDLE